LASPTETSKFAENLFQLNVTVAILNSSGCRIEAGKKLALCNDIQKKKKIRMRHQTESITLWRGQLTKPNCASCSQNQWTNSASSFSQRKRRTTLFTVAGELEELLAPTATRDASGAESHVDESGDGFGQDEGKAHITTKIAANFVFIWYDFLIVNTSNQFIWRLVGRVLALPRSISERQIRAAYHVARDIARDIARGCSCDWPTV
jgi:hypothetical protein